MKRFLGVLLMLCISMTAFTGLSFAEDNEKIDVHADSVRVEMFDSEITNLTFNLNGKSLPTDWLDEVHIVVEDETVAQAELIETSDGIAIVVYGCYLGETTINVYAAYGSAQGEFAVSVRVLWKEGYNCTEVIIKDVPNEIKVGEAASFRAALKFNGQGVSFERADAIRVQSSDSNVISVSYEVEGDELIVNLFGKVVDTAEIDIDVVYNGISGGIDFDMDVVTDEYIVSAIIPENGTLLVSQTKAMVGTEVTISATPAIGYELVTVKVNGTPIEGNVFEMPDEDVIVTVEFEAIEYTVNTVEPENGSLFVSQNKATIGTEVIVSATPAMGYKLVGIKVNGTPIVDDRFKMSNRDVEITAEFELIQYAVNLSSINGAQIRTKGSQGLRFISTIDKASVDFNHVVEFGTILIPSEDISDISELQIGATLNGHTVAKVPAKKIYDETQNTITYTAVLTDIKVKNYTRAYTARAYAIMDNGTVVYGNVGASRSIYQVAKRGLQDPYASAYNKAIFQEIVDAVSNDDTWGGIY